MRLQQTLCNADELVSQPYETGVLLLCHTDEMLSRPYEIKTVVVSYRAISKSSLWDMLWQCYTDEMSNPMCAIATNLSSYGRVDKFYVRDTNSCYEMLSPTYKIATILMLYGWVRKSSVFQIAIVAISYGRVTKSSVWDSMMLKRYGVTLLCHRSKHFHLIVTAVTPQIRKHGIHVFHRGTSDKFES